MIGLTHRCETIGNPFMQTEDMKQAAHDIINRLPDGATWESMIYELDLRASIERGRADIKSGRVMTTNELKQQLGLDE